MFTGNYLLRYYLLKTIIAEEQRQERERKEKEEREEQEKLKNLTYPNQWIE